MPTSYTRQEAQRFVFLGGLLGLLLGFSGRVLGALGRSEDRKVDDANIVPTAVELQHLLPLQSLLRFS